MSRPIGEISTVFDPAVGLQASDVSEAEEEVTYLLLFMMPLLKMQKKRLIRQRVLFLKLASYYFNP
jgi:hypothetical protein